MYLSHHGVQKAHTNTHMRTMASIEYLHFVYYSRMAFSFSVLLLMLPSPPPPPLLLLLLDYFFLLWILLIFICLLLSLRESFWMQTIEWCVHEQTVNVLTTCYKRKTFAKHVIWTIRNVVCVSYGMRLYV